MERNPIKNLNHKCMVVPVLNFFEERSYFQISIKKLPNVTKNRKMGSIKEYVFS